MNKGSSIVVPKKVDKSSTTFEFLSGLLREFELIYNLSPKLNLQQIKKLQLQFSKIIKS